MMSPVSQPAATKGNKNLAKSNQKGSTPDLIMGNKKGSLSTVFKTIPKP